MWRHILNIIYLFDYYIYDDTYQTLNIYMFYYIYYVLFNDNSYKPPIVIIAVYDNRFI